MCLNHPETIPPTNPAWSMEKLSSKKPVPGAQKVGTADLQNFSKWSFRSVLVVGATWGRIFLWNMVLSRPNLVQ